MGQYWMFLNIDKRKQLVSYADLKLWGIVASSALEPLVGLLRTPPWAPYAASPEGIRLSKQRLSVSPLVNLPQEIVDKIVSSIDSDQESADITCLALTCSYFFRLLATRIQKALAVDTAPWAGDRLICLGDYADGVPPGIATDAEFREWQVLGPNPLYELPTGYFGEEEGHEKNAPRHEFFDPDPSEVECSGVLTSRVLERAGYEAFTLIQHTLQNVPLDRNAQKKQAAVLRNLNLMEYVLDEAVATSPVPYSLGEVLGLLTMWTDDGSGTEGLENGRWAGHQFDIASLDDVATGGWKNISEEAVDRLEAFGLEGDVDGRRVWE